jgi:hypothetical protein
MIYSGKLIALNFDSAKRMASFSLFLSVAFIIFTIAGCCGAFNQTVREGLCSGRRTLCCHQCLLITILIMSTLQVEELKRRQHSLEFVIDNEHLVFKSYDSFETRLDKYFNRAYFETICATNDENKFLLGFIDENCPDSMSTKECALTPEQKTTCDTSCLVEPSPTLWKAEKCCPSKELCVNLGLDRACPYFSCRIAILEEVQSLIHPSLLFLRLVSAFSAMMVTFTCLLICYNPRDDIEIELLKTGVMTEDDVRTIRDLKKKSGRNFNYDKGKRAQQSINLDQLHRQKEKDESRLTQASRRSTKRSTGRIHPVKHSSP